jgi:nucleotide-binding universal stress UspA family protein
MTAFPPRRILVPVDFSDVSSKAWGFARDLAARVGARMETVYVSRSSSGPEMALPAMARTYEGAAEHHVLEGDVILGILRTARKRRADLIVMATGGRTGLKRLLVPSVAEDVVRASPIPVLAVHGELAGIASVLAPVNMKPYSLEGLRFAEKVARRLNVGLTALFVEDDSSSRPLAWRRLRCVVDDLHSPVKTEVSVVAGKPLEKILENAAAHGLVVMTVHRKGLFHNAVLGSTAEQILRQARVPVLALPPAYAAVKTSRAAGRRDRRAKRRPLRRTASRGRRAAISGRRSAPSMLLR